MEQQKQRLFVFANRTDPNSVGGLTSLMNDHLPKLLEDYEVHFVGWSGNDGKDKKGNYVGFPTEETRMPAKTRVLDGIHYHTVDFTEDEYKKGYCGFQNQDFWPHAHGMPQNARNIENGFEINKKISSLFVDTAVKHAGFCADDVAFVNDYQLMMMGQVMDEKGIDCLKSFHDHIPVPDLKHLQASEKNKKTKVAYYQELFGSLKHYDHIGFQREQDIRKALEIVGIKSEQNRYEPYAHYQENGFNICYNPVCINVEKFQQAAEDNRNHPEVLEYEKKYLGKGKTTFVIPCRYDYAKKHDLLLDGVREYCKTYPERGKDVQVILIGGPSRADIPVYQQYSNTIEKKVAEINAEFADDRDNPVVVELGKVDRDVLAGIMGLGDQVVFTGGVDGMNLVVLEALAANRDNILVTSEYCGAKDLLGDNVISLKNILNSHQLAREEMVDCIDRCVSITNSPEKKKKNFQMNKEVYERIQTDFKGENWMKTNVVVFGDYRQ